MHSHQIEAWALNAIDRVIRGQSVEDSRVELKAEWPRDPSRAARRLAAHVNASRGAPVLWLIGVDEACSEPVVGADRAEFSSWYAQVASCFVELAPAIVDINVPVGDVTVVALFLESDRVPLVVKNPLFGQAGQVIASEIPWREGTSVRSARRSDLLRLLVPLSVLPILTPLDGTLTVKRSDEEPPEWHLSLTMYVDLTGSDAVVFPDHLYTATLAFPGWTVPLHTYMTTLKRAYGARTRESTMRQEPHRTALRGEQQLLVLSSSPIRLAGTASFDPPASIELERFPEVAVVLHLEPAGAGRRIPVSPIPMQPIRPMADEIGRWVLKTNAPEGPHDS